MKPKVKKSILAGIPSWVLALLTLIIATVMMFLIGEEVVPHIIHGNKGDAIPYILYSIVVTVCCFFIVKENPSSIWYVPIICNVTGILIAITAPNFWISTSMWVPICGGFLLSMIASISGTLKGRKSIISDNP
jgi:hypothetical protein